MVSVLAPRTAPVVPLKPVLPFLKWAGGKRQLMGELKKVVPAEFNRYYEPFVGSAALFFNLRPHDAVLGDQNTRLIRTYRAIRDELDAVIERLRTYPHDREFFLDLRQSPIDDGTDVEVACWLIYLNKTGYNGLYRVNRKGLFNVPFGRYSNPTICDESRLRACSEALQGVELVNESFEDSVRSAQPGDFVYFDPPYVPLSATSYFASYTNSKFALEEHIALRDLAYSLKERGVHVAISNSSAPVVFDLYRDDFRVKRVAARRSINSRGGRRGKVDEVLIT